MKLFISWSGPISKAIATEFREWLPLINQTIVPYMSSEDIEKGTLWSSSIRQELDSTSFGILIVTPENTESPWLHFEAGAIAKSVIDGRAAPILFGLKPSDIHQPLALFQATAFEKDEISRLLKTINQAAGEFGRTEKQLDTVFETFWPKLDQAIRPKLEQLKSSPRKAEVQKQETDHILQELLLLNRQQLRKLSNPDELFGKELLGLLLRIVHEPEGAAIRLANNERDLAMALCGRWSHVARTLRSGKVSPTPDAQEVVYRYSNYLAEFQAILSGTATPDSISKVLGTREN